MVDATDVCVCIYIYIYTYIGSYGKVRGDATDIYIYIYITNIYIYIYIYIYISNLGYICYIDKVIWAKTELKASDPGYAAKKTITKTKNIGGRGKDGG